VPIAQYVGTSVLLRQRTALLYSRLNETVHVEVLDDAGRPHLVVSGPANRRRTRDFADEASLSLFLERLRRKLTGQGFELIASVERRSGAERRSSRRVETDRRRG